MTRNEPLLAVLEYIPIPKYNRIFTAMPAAMPAVSRQQCRQERGNRHPPGRQVRAADFKQGIKLRRAHSGCLGANRR